MHPEDVAAGFKRRRLSFVARKPADHFITVNDERHDTELCCDTCNGPIDGMPAVAVTMWMSPREWEPFLWEPRFGYKGDYCPSNIPKKADGKKHKIEAFYAFIIENEDGEGVPAVVGGGSPYMMPLIGSDKARIESLREAAQMCATQHQMPITLCKFEKRTELEVIMPEKKKEADER